MRSCPLPPNERRQSMPIRHILPLALLVACGGSTSDVGAEAAPQTLTLTGSSTIAPLAAELGRAFEAAHPGARVDVQTGGSSRGIADARAGTADLGMASRALGPDEADLTAHTIARDGVALIVHATNPVEALDSAAVLGLYRGEITDWAAVGGAAGPVTVVNKAEGRSTLELFLHYFGLQNSEIKASVVIGDNEQGVKTVAGNPAAVGYVSIGTAQHDVDDGVPIKLLPMDGVAATTAHVRDGSFPLSRPLNLVSHGEPGPMAAAFIAFAQSAEAAPIVTSLSFVPVGP